ncbi:amidase [Castellaniella sp.]|uniref:amidase n=1 Tax=Castellaniella sp. TaxID=1955812 RepID=UPI003560798B
MQVYEYEALDGVALADVLSAGDASPEEVMACAIELARVRAEPHRAICHPAYEESLALARQGGFGGRFGGLPFLLKDSGLASMRLPSSLGSALFANTTFAGNATLTDRFEQAGLIPFARTCVPELCMAPTTEATHNGGPTLNPWDHSRSAGGSSGGAAVAVALGVVPVAHGSDGGGSIRIPAACCGLFGLKPTRGRVPIGPFRGEGWGGLASDGVLSRSVRDTAAALDAVMGWESGAPYAAPPAPASYEQLIRQDFERPLRIVVWRTAWRDVAIDPECLKAVDNAAALCRSAGHEVVVEDMPDLDYDAFVQAHIRVLSANIVVSVEARLRALGRPLRDGDLEWAILDGYHMGKQLPAGDYVRSINLFHSIGQLFESQMASCDLVLTPALTQLPAPLGYLSMQAGFAEFRQRVADYTTFLALINASGQPAASVPLHWTAGNVPVGVQLIGHFGREDQILQLSAQLEAMAPWAARRPCGAL